MDLALACDSLAPAAVFRSLRRAGIPAERRPMGREPPGPIRRTDDDPLAGCGMDFAILLDGRPLAGFRRLRPDEVVVSLLRLQEEGGGGPPLRLDGLRRIPLGLLVLEGRLSGKYHPMEPALYSFQYWCFRNHLFVFHTPDMDGTAAMLEVLFRKMQRSLHGLEAQGWACAAGRI